MSSNATGRMNWDFWKFIICFSKRFTVFGARELFREFRKARVGKKTIDIAQRHGGPEIIESIRDFLRMEKGINPTIRTGGQIRRGGDFNLYRDFLGGGGSITKLLSERNVDDMSHHLNLAQG